MDLLNVREISYVSRINYKMAYVINTRIFIKKRKSTEFIGLFVVKLVIWCNRWLVVTEVRNKNVVKLVVHFSQVLAISKLVTARKRSCGKVMFSQVSVCPHTSPPGPYPSPRDHSPQLLTPSGGHHTYGRQVCSTHPTGMHSR